MRAITYRAGKVFISIQIDEKVFGSYKINELREVDGTTTTIQ